MLTTYFSGTMPILGRREVFLLICAKRILNRLVAAAIAYREQVSPAHQLERVPPFRSEGQARAHAFLNKWIKLIVDRRNTESIT